MEIKLHRYSFIFSVYLWLALGILTIGSILVSSLGWIVNLGMGLLFIIIGCLMYLHGNSLHRFYKGSMDKLQEDPNFQRFLRLDLLFVIISCIVISAMLTGAFIRIFIEGFAVFG
jgi:hypothetical protein